MEALLELPDAGRSDCREPEMAPKIIECTTFHDRNTTGADYFYDRNGSMTKDLNKEIDSIYYNHLNLTDKVVFATGDSILYFYDAAGIKLRQEVYKAGTLKMKRDYVGEFYYENDTLKFIHHEEGRVVIRNDELAYEYHLKDHLGNTRLTFSTTPESYTYTATMETELATSEEALFQNVAETRVAMASANSTPTTVVAGANKAARIESTDPIGPLAMLQVNKGDTVKLSAYAYYEGDGSTDGLISESAILAALFAGYSGASGVSEVSSQTQAAIENGLDFPNNLVPKTNETNDDAPKAYINYMLFDEEMTFVTSGFVQISTAAQFSQELVVMEPVTIDQNGYLMAYVSNESDELNYVHFDDFTVTHTKTPVVSASSYYPFGTEFSTFTRNYSEPQRYKYQGKELQEETEIYDFHARGYDPYTVRTWQMDPMAEMFYSLSPYSWAAGNPMRYVDPTGMVIEDGSKKEWDRQKGYVQNRRDNLQGRVDKLSAKAEAKGWSAEKLANKTGNLTERVASLDGTLSTLGTLESSEQVYSLSQAAPGDNGGVTLNTETNAINISFGTTSNFVHEATHAGQFETGDIAFDSNTGATLAADIQDEVAGYKAQFAYDPSSVSGLTSTAGVANSFSGITSQWVQGLAGGTLYVPGGTANTGVSPLNINSTRSDFIKAFPNNPAIRSLPANFVLKKSYPSIYYKK